jgi:hypothetical protein
MSLDVREHDFDRLNCIPSRIYICIACMEFQCSFTAVVPDAFRIALDWHWQV